MPRSSESGFTILDMLVTVMLLSVMMVLVLPGAIDLKEDAMNFVVEYNYVHACSFLEGSEMENDYSDVPIRFNNNSTPNQGQSFSVGNRKIVIRPITGYLRVE